MTPSEQEGYIDAFEHPERCEPELCARCGVLRPVNFHDAADATVIRCAVCGHTIDKIWKEDSQ